MLAGARHSRIWLAALMALALLLRAPGVTATGPAAPGDGWIPICSGGAIIIVYVGDGPPPGDGPPDGAHGQPCAAFGLGHFAPPTPAWLALSGAPQQTPRPLCCGAEAASRTAVAFRSRAPPVAPV